MSQDQARSGGYRNDGMRRERDHATDAAARPGKASDSDAHATPLPEDRLGNNEMSKAWARESYRADYTRISQRTRNDFGQRRVEDGKETQER